MPFIGERSIITPPSRVARPATLWPPPRTATSSPSLRVRLIASTTSATPLQRAIKAGRLSTRPLWTLLASSYPTSAGLRSCPENVPDNSAATSATDRTELMETLLLGFRSQCLLPPRLHEEQRRIIQPKVKHFHLHSGDEQAAAPHRVARL